MELFRRHTKSLNGSSRERQHRIGKNQRRRISRRLDDNPETSAVISPHASYRKCTIEFLDSFSTEYRDNVRDCLEKIKPLAVILQPPMTQPMIEQAEYVAGLFPPSVSVDSLPLAVELENSLTETEETCKFFCSLYQ